MVETIAIAAAAGAAVLTPLALLLRGRKRRRSTATPVGEDGFQEATIKVNGRYRPGIVKVRSGRPVRLRFVREEDTPCSERVIFEGLGVERRLKAHRETLIDLKAMPPGRYMFTCQMGIYRGWLVAVNQ